MKNNLGKKEKVSILTRQIVCLLLFMAATIALLVAIAKNAAVLAIFVLPVLCVITFCMFLYSLLLSYKIYHYNGKTIVVYAGHWNHYIKIDGVLLDEHKSFTKWFTIYLSGTHENAIFEAKITNLGRISLKINNKLYY